MSLFLLILHVAAAIFLILVVLLQTGKGAALGAAFGGSSDTLFGSRGPASFLSKITTAAAVIFMTSSFALSMLSAKVDKGTVVEGIIQEETQPMPAEPPDTSTIDPFKSPTENADDKNSGAAEPDRTKE